MYRGTIVEEGAAPAVLQRPMHPYTRLLRAAVPAIDETDGFVKEPTVGRAEGAGCLFHHRCPAALSRCAREAPALAAMADGRRAACFALESGQ
jgi:peptide/nickel transport system ATP-binding protein